jgi:glutamine amidotransferase
MQPIVIVDYGMANLRSVQKAFEKVGAAAEISGDPNRIAEADKVVLPGVGAFRDAIARLREGGLAQPLVEHIRAGKPFLGICLGLQMLFTTSYEDGVFAGLDLFPGEVVRFPDEPGLKVPHMGWNQLRIRRRAPMLEDTPDGAAVYFVHSYYVVPKDARLVATETDYPTPFASAIWYENVFATQFHPEKSQRIGLAMLRRFVEWGSLRGNKAPQFVI